MNKGAMTKDREGHGGVGALLGEMGGWIGSEDVM